MLLLSWCIEGGVPLSSLIYHNCGPDIYSCCIEDVFSFPNTNKNFRLLYDRKVGFSLHSIRDKESKLKFCKVRSTQFGQKGIPYMNTYDGRTIR
ncbi:hypothetical protein L1987_10727 [Smallanthus sonchifolius]|uniref:Uncharacterized protein n=1 Tax=Smallanthus sonchifolius TaxID=185202 RepID=A0ACB9JCE7_9ASTR|nr:hypothetical protein L1987_10727 [Smallanthus sonchifolius]